MAADKYLKNMGSYDEEVAGTQTSTGATEAGKIVALNDDGVLDETLMPPGIVPLVYKVVASEALVAGNFVNLWDDSGTLKARKADATTIDKKADGYVRDNADADEEVNVYVEDWNDKLSGLTLGAEYFLSDSTPGGVTATAPSTGTHIVQYLGKAVSATKLIVEIDRPTKKA